MKMEQLALPFKQDFKLGDRVMILSKSVGLPHRGFNKGYIVRINKGTPCNRNYKVEVFYSVSTVCDYAMGGYHFLAKDLRRI